MHDLQSRTELRRDTTYTRRVLVSGLFIRWPVHPIGRRWNFGRVRPRLGNLTNSAILFHFRAEIERHFGAHLLPREAYLDTAMNRVHRDTPAGVSTSHSLLRSLFVVTVLFTASWVTASRPTTASTARPSPWASTSAPGPSRCRPIWRRKRACERGAGCRAPAGRDEP